MNQRTPREALPSFEELFGVAATVRANAPGRVNLIGEHTDYNGGFVLPAAIPQRTVVELRPREDRTVAVWSANAGAGDEWKAYTLGTETAQGSWIDYVQGTTRILATLGHRLSGCSLRVASTVPVGSGLSSSAALEVSLLRALREVFQLEFDDVQLARIGQRVENEFVGAPVGIMDQMACALAGDSHALFLDTRNLTYEQVPIPARAELLVIDSGVPHNHAAGDYRTRKAECDRAAAMLGVAQLRDLAPEESMRADALPAPLPRRVRHVVTENARVLAAVQALRAGDLQGLGELFSQSHASMRDDFEVSVPEIDRLVALADEYDDVFGARLTGGGFGGSIVAAVSRGSARRIGEQVVREYGNTTGRSGTVVVPVLR